MNMGPLIAILAVCMFGLIYLVLDWIRDEIKDQREDKQEIEGYDKTKLVARALDQYEKRNYNPLHPYQGLPIPVILTRPLVVKRSSSSPPATTTRPTVFKRSLTTQPAARTSHWALTPGIGLTTGNNTLPRTDRKIVAIA